MGHYYMDEKAAQTIKAARALIEVSQDNPEWLATAESMLKKYPLGAVSLNVELNQERQVDLQPADHFWFFGELVTDWQNAGMNPKARKRLVERVEKVVNENIGPNWRKELRDSEPPRVIPRYGWMNEQETFSLLFIYKFDNNGNSLKITAWSRELMLDTTDLF